MKIIDMHCDTLIECWRDSKRSLFDGEGSLNLKMMLEHNGMAQYFAIYLSQHELKTMEPYDLFHRIYDYYLEEMVNNEDIIKPAFYAEDIVKNSKDGFLSSFLTIEDGIFVDGKIERIDEVYKLGVRLITLLWGFENSMGYPCSDDNDQNLKGLKPFGFEVVEKMNDLGIIIDVSHMSEGGFYDVANLSKVPFVASHSCAKALCDHKRNLTDRQLKTIGDKGGIVGVNFECSFLKEGSDYATVDQVISHIKHMVNKAGIHSVGFGSDFDGIEPTGQIMNYCDFDLILGAMEKEFSYDEIDKICNRNVLRVMKDILGK